MDTESPVVWPSWCYSGDGNSAESAAADSAANHHHHHHHHHNHHQHQRHHHLKARKRKIMNGNTNNNNNNANTTNILDFHHLNNNNNNNNNNNVVKNERLSPDNGGGGEDNNTASRSRSVTPHSSSASYPGTPPSSTTAATMLQQQDSTMATMLSATTNNSPLLSIVSGRNYSDFMRSLAAKYNNSVGGSTTTTSAATMANNANDYLTSVRNGFLDPGRFKPFPAGSSAHQQQPALSAGKESPSPSASPSSSSASSAANSARKSDHLAASALFHPFPPLIDMSSSQALMAMARTAKEAEAAAGLLLQKASKRASADFASPLDLSAAAAVPKRPRSAARPAPGGGLSEDESAGSPKLQDNSVAAWTVDDVCSFVAGIDICAEYVQNFREQRIDGSGLPLLTEDHLTTTMQMKLGPALKLRSLLARRLGTCAVCLHCTHCHASAQAPQPPPAPPPSVVDSAEPLRYSVEKH